MVYLQMNSYPIFEWIQNRNTKYFWVLVLAYFAFVILFPIRNMNWGDGLVLLETNLFETKLFGFQFTLDEIGETVVHSFLLRIFGFIGLGDDPRYSYRLLSNVSGIILAFVLLKKLRDKSMIESIGILFVLCFWRIFIIFWVFRKLFARHLHSFYFIFIALFGIP